MKELYFINLVGNLNSTAWVLFGVLCFALFVIMVAYCAEGVDKEQLKKFTKPIIVVAAVCFALGIFLPSKKDSYIIFGIGSVVDYIQDNDEARRLPDKTIKALNAFADKYTQTKEEER